MFLLKDEMMDAYLSIWLDSNINSIESGPEKEQRKLLNIL